MGETPDNGLVAQGLHYGYGKQPILCGIDLAVGSGEIVSLLGCNGAGKSTLIRLLLGIERPQRGEVRLNGEVLVGKSRREIARNLAYVPQNHISPFPYLVRDVVMMGRLPMTGLFRAAGLTDHAVVDEMMDKLRIAHLADRPYTQISGGERQLALIARALCQGARILVMDEPTGGLDYGNQIRLLERLSDLSRSGYAVLMSTHNPDHALIISTRVAMLHRGRIVEDGPPAEVVTPDTIRLLYDVDVASIEAEQGYRMFLPKGIVSRRQAILKKMAGTFRFPPFSK